MKKYRLLFLDFDGVISDSLQICMEEINRLRGKFPIIPEVRTREDMARVYSVELRHSLYPFGLNDEETREFFDCHSSAMNQRAAEVEPFHEAVRALANYPLPKVIITSSYSEAVFAILRKCEEFDETFVQSVYGREQHKTKTEKIRSALTLFNANVSDALYVGDLASDVLYCRDVPVDIACVGYGYHPSSYLKKFSPEYILETVEDFAVFLQNLSPTQQP
ncbi:MAG: Phosphoglycolate phosphatase PpaX [Parcubacteria group bacterium GW2011_GWB1_50_9]|nr:MAG: Phosphoglycolate phosphatase PpaX [Parcubacteria group bacterium GW2011_GWB1_50_9]